MFSLTCDEVQVVTAAIARVARCEAHTFNDSDAINKMADSVLADEILVYDRGPYGKKTRTIKFLFSSGLCFEVPVCPQPEYVNHDNRPDDDGGPGGTPIAMAA